MDSRKKNLIEEMKKLRSIKADDGFKFALRKRMFEEAGKSFVINMSGSRHHSQQASNLQKIFINLLPKKQNMFLPLLLIAALLGSSAGATYASQSSLPGETLYPVKLATEKAQTVLNVNDNAKEADLHIKFSEKRLYEIDALAQKGEAKLELVREAVDKYKEELSEAKNILTSASVVGSDQSIQIAKSLADATNHSKETLVKISGEVDSDDALDILKDAWKEAVEHNDIATIELLKSLTSDMTAAANTTSTTNTVANTNTADTTISTAATGTQNQAAVTTSTNQAVVAVPVQDQQSQNMVNNKMAEASHKISEAERYIVKKESRGADVGAAKIKIAEAKTLLADSQNLLNQAKYTEAFLRAKDAHRAAQIAKESLENDHKDKNHKEEDGDDDENIFVLPAAISDTSASNSSTGTASVRSETDYDQDNDDEDKKEKKHDKEKEEDHD